MPLGFVIVLGGSIRSSYARIQPRWDALIIAERSSLSVFAGPGSDRLSQNHFDGRVSQRVMKFRRCVGADELVSHSLHRRGQQPDFEESAVA